MPDKMIGIFLCPIYLKTVKTIRDYPDYIITQLSDVF